MTLKICKILTPNDVGSTGSNQAGIHVTKKDPTIIEFFPILDPAKPNPEQPLTLFDIDTDSTLNFRFIYFNKKFFGGTRDEYRITSGSDTSMSNYSLTSYLKRVGASPSDVMVLWKDTSTYYVGWTNIIEIQENNDIKRSVGSWHILHTDSYNTTPIQSKIQTQRATDLDIHIQENAAITGNKAEDYFMKWVRINRPEWGPPQRRTNKVGLGFDVEFPKAGYKIEVKGSRGDVQPIRMTKHEWYRAQKDGSSYFLVIVANLDKTNEEKVHIIQNPYHKLSDTAKQYETTQIHYSIPKESLNLILNLVG